MTEITRKGLNDRQRWEMMSSQEKIKTTFGMLEQITAGVAQHNRTLFEINKVAAIGNAIISTLEGAAKALEWGWPMGPIFAGLMYASGMARVAAIISTQYGSGGAGSAPSVVGTTPAPPVSPVGESKGSSTPQTTIIEMAVNDPGEADLIERFADALNQRSIDGGNILVRRSRRAGFR